MSYVVVMSFTVKTKQGDLTLSLGQVITLAEEKAVKLIVAGKIKPIEEPKQQPEPQIIGYGLAERMSIEGENCSPEQVKPYVTDYGSLIIPWNSDPKYHYWNKGQGICDTLKELGRCDLIEKYKSIYN
jgi:hypothetical protein